MGEFNVGNVVRPVLRLAGAIDAEISFDLLIGAFSLSIGLRVISGGHGGFDAGKFADLLEGFRSELRSSVGDNAYWESKSSVYIVKVELSGTKSINGFGAGHENNGFRAIVVDNQ